MKKAAYIGAGVDMSPLLLFPDIKGFIYIDSRPFTECGSTLLEPYPLLFSTSIHFLENIVQVMKQNNFILIKHDIFYCYIFYNHQTNQTVKYFYNCVFPLLVNHEILYELQTCDTLIMCGFHPDKIILNYIQKNPTIIGDSDTSYTIDETNIDNENSIIKELHYKPEIAKNYLLIQNVIEYEYWKIENIVPSVVQNYEIIKCDTIKGFCKN